MTLYIVKSALGGGVVVSRRLSSSLSSSESGSSSDGGGVEARDREGEGGMEAGLGTLVVGS